MKVSLDLLKKFVAPPKGVAVRQLAETLTMHTVEVEAYVDQSEKFSGVVVGVVKNIRPHPDANKLKLATVDAGKESFEVVCGGVNLKDGQKVVLAKVGAKVRWHGEDKWTELKPAKIRGVESNGMICAAEELELTDLQAIPHGIMDLSHLKAKAGTPLAEALGLSDIILDVDNKSLTHRPDLWGHLGIARELAAIWQIPLHEPAPPPVPERKEIGFKVTVKAPELVRRYMGVVLGGIKVGPSPEWLQRALTAVGARSINNVVDVTNYVMYELGQPLHAFDLAKMTGSEIVVRTAKRDERLTTLDGAERELASSTLVIADTKQALAVAGVMGGVNSEVSNATATLVLESANFDAVSIRQTSASLGLRTEASVRFEKALDPELAAIGLKRAVELLLEIMPTAHVMSAVEDIYVRPLEIKPIELSVDWLHARLGMELSALKVQSILASLGFKLKSRGDKLVVMPPSWRATRDITIPEDLLEEVARIHGYDKVPPVLPKFEITPPPKDEAQDLRWKIRDLLVGAGWTETYSYSFVSKHAQGEVEIDNPVDQTKRWLRPRLLASLEEQFESARRAGRGTVKLFELGRVFRKTEGVFGVGAKGGSTLPSQPWHLALAAYEPDGTGLRALKGVFKLIEQELNLASLRHELQGDSGAYMAEVELDELSPAPVREYQSLPKYPSITRDVSMVVPTGVTWESIASAVTKLSQLIKSVEVIDVYEAKRSIAYRITFRSAERTLTSQEVEAEMAKLTKLLKDKFNATIR